MANLTEISIGARKFFVWLVVVFIAYLILRLLLSIGISYWRATHPPPIPPPQMQFGKLPHLKFKSELSTSGMKFALENIAGTPALDKPQIATNAAKVYRMPKKLPTLLSEERAKKFAARLGFTKDPILKSSTEYYFIDPTDQYRNLTLDIVNMNFNLRYDWAKNPQILKEGKFISREQAIAEVKNYLQVNNLFDSTILNGKITLDFLTTATESAKNNFVAVNSLVDADAVRLNFFRPDLDDFKILPPEFFQSYIYVLFTPAKKTNQQMLEISWIFWPIETSNFGTYPIKSAPSAWQDLVDGYAVVINMGNNSTENIIIRHIYLAYFDSNEPQPFLQPIYVFEGDNGFVAYLPAITPEWLE